MNLNLFLLCFIILGTTCASEFETSITGPEQNPKSATSSTQRVPDPRLGANVTTGSPAIPPAVTTGVDSRLEPHPPVTRSAVTQLQPTSEYSETCGTEEHNLELSETSTLILSSEAGNFVTIMLKSSSETSACNNCSSHEFKLRFGKCPRKILFNLISSGPSHLRHSEHNETVACEISVEAINRVTQLLNYQSLIKTNPSISELRNRFKPVNQCDDPVVIQLIDAALQIKAILLTLSQAQFENQIDLFNFQQVFRKTLNEFQTFINKMRQKQNTAVNEHLKLLLSQTISLQEETNENLMHMTDQVNSRRNMKIESCVFQIQVYDRYPSCDELSESITQNASTARTIITSAYENEAVDKIMQFISQMKNATQQIICYEALVEQLIDKLHLDNINILIILDNIQNLLAVSPNKQIILDYYTTRSTKLQSLLMSQIDCVVQSLTKEITNKIFSKVAMLTVQCPHCLDIIDLKRSNQTVLGRIITALYSNDIEQVKTILQLNEELRIVTHNVVCLETLIELMKRGELLYTPMVFLVHHSLQNVIESPQYLQTSDKDIRDRVSNLRLEIASPLQEAFEMLAEEIQVNETGDILEFSNQHPSAFRSVVPDLIKTAYRSRVYNLENILTFLKKLTNIKTYVLSLKVLVNVTEESGHLSSPYVLLLNQSLARFDDRRAFGRTFTPEIKKDIALLIVSLKKNIGEIIKMWATLILDGNFKSILHFVRKHQMAFEPVIDLLVRMTYDMKPDKMVTILNFALALPKVDNRYKIYKNLMDNIIKDQTPNNYMFFVLDECIDTLLPKITTEGEDMKFEVELLKIELDEQINIEFWNLANMVLESKFINITTFSTKFPDTFARILPKMIDTIYSREDKNIFPILEFAENLDNTSHTSMAYSNIVQMFCAKTPLNIPMSVGLLEYMEQVTKQSHFVLLPIAIKSELTSSIGRLSRSLALISQSSNYHVRSGTSDVHHKQITAVDAILQTIQKLVEAGKTTKIIRILSFFRKLPATQILHLFEWLILTVQTSALAKSPEWFILEQFEIQTFSDINKSLRSKNYDSTFNRATKMMFELSKKLVNDLATRINSNNRSELVKFAKQHKNVLKLYLTNITEQAFSKQTNNIPGIISFVKDVDDLGLATIIIKHLHTIIVKHIGNFNNENLIELAYFIMDTVQSSMFTSLSSSDQSSWNSMKNSFHSNNIIYALLRNEKACILNKATSRYLRGSSLLKMGGHYSNGTFVSVYHPTQSLDSECRWKISTLDGRKFTFMNARSNEYMQVRNDRDGKYSRDTRFVNTWSNQIVMPDTGTWKLKQYTSNQYYIINVGLEEFLFASDVTCKLDANRRHVFTSPVRVYSNDRYVWTITHC